MLESTDAVSNTFEPKSRIKKAVHLLTKKNSP